MESNDERKSDRERSTHRPGDGSAGRRTGWLATVGVLVVAIGATALLLRGGEQVASASAVEFTDVERQAREFIDYYNEIELTPRQEKVKREALSRIPAPCCSDNSALTCCCPCNMAKTWWGLSHHLIANEGYGADEVQEAVEEWIAFINPQGFSGDACYRGGCSRPFHRNGCGGMDESRLVF